MRSGDLRRHRTHYDVIVMLISLLWVTMTLFTLVYWLRFFPSIHPSISKFRWGCCLCPIWWAGSTRLCQTPALHGHCLAGQCQIGHIYFTHSDHVFLGLLHPLMPGIARSLFFLRFTLKHRETHGCVVSTVTTDALVLKHQAISIHNAD